MKSQVQELDVKMGTLQRQITTATYKCEVIEDHVMRLMQEASVKKEEVDKILEDQKEFGKGWWKAWCLNLKSRYLSSRKATRKTRDLVELVKRSSFKSISHPPPPPGIVSSSARERCWGSYVEFESRFYIMGHVMEALKDDAIHTIGIWGMAGVGKTTMVNEVYRKAREKHMFDEIVKVVVRQEQVLKGIQGNIAELLGLNLVGEDLFARALALHERLTQGGKTRLIILDDVWNRLDLDDVGIPCGDDFDSCKIVLTSRDRDVCDQMRTDTELLGLNLVGEDLFARALALHERLTQGGKTRLIILDDVWNRLDLDDVGIPCGDDFDGCKIVLTSRDRDVCDQMRADINFHLEVLHTEEAQHLFKTLVDYSSFQHDWRLIAEGIVEECAGFPLAITTIATVLVKKKEATWRDVLRQLQNAALEGSYAKVYEAIRVSYNFLESEGIKKFFLLCCLFPENSDIPIEDLVRYGVGRRLFEKTNDLQEAKNQAYAHVEKLQISNLLLPSYEGHVKMHDLVRDFSISITS
ncbi:hypothetical protein LguiB_004121 [Lonicera macranthoides]